MIPFNEYFFFLSLCLCKSPSHTREITLDILLLCLREVHEALDATKWQSFKVHILILLIFAKGKHI